MKTILMAEDNKAVQGIISNVLLDTGDYKVQIASDGQEALDILNKTNIDIVLSDLDMPVLDGYELLSTMRTSPNHAHIPFIMMTANDVPYHIPIQGFLRKPFQIDDLLEEVDQRIERGF